MEDIGKFVAAIFADRTRFAGKTFEIASDTVTGHDIETLFTKAADRPISYSRFSNTVLAANPFLDRLTALLDQGPLASHAGLNALREISPEIQSFATWLARSGRTSFEQAPGTAGAWTYDNGWRSLLFCEIVCIARISSRSGTEPPPRLPCQRISALVSNRATGFGSSLTGSSASLLPC